ncbi:Uncharacterised protein [uncultured archaeon]|nr:Uncharacterised protein [uncultured archaeon]
MLIITAQQVQNTDGICAYVVKAFINTRPIWEGTVGGHIRSNGWPVLAGHIARKAGLQSPEELRTIEQSLKVAVDGLKHCPVCDRILGYAE